MNTTGNQALQTLIEAAPLAMQTLDTEGNVLFWNSAAESMFSYSRPEVIGRLLPIVPEEDLAHFMTLSQQVLMGKTFVDIEIRPRTKMGTQIDASLSVAPLFDEQGNIYGSIAMFANITGRKQQEREREAMLILATELRAVTSRVEMAPVILR